MLENWRNDILSFTSMIRRGASLSATVARLWLVARYWLSHTKPHWMELRLSMRRSCLLILTRSQTRLLQAEAIKSSPKSLSSHVDHGYQSSFRKFFRTLSMLLVKRCFSLELLEATCAFRLNTCQSGLTSTI